jgi:hypothetical protein
VHYRNGAGKITFGSANGRNTQENFPYKVSWAVAEVVTIWKEHESVDAMQKFGRSSNLAAEYYVMIEIRWFYRKHELSGAAKIATISENTAKHVEYEDIFETDLVDECEALSPLGPVLLHESHLRLVSSKTEQGMPLIEVCCCRFWSIHRKSLMPMGSMSRRIERGRMHSKYFGNGAE